MMGSKVAKVMLALILALVLGLAALWLMSDEEGNRRFVWVPPAPTKPDFSFVVAMEPNAAEPTGPSTPTLSRPLFSESRRPPAPKSAASAPQGAPPPPPPPPDPLNNTSIQGLVVGAGNVSVIARIEGNTRVVRQGQTIGSWTLRSIRDREVTFVQGGQKRVMKLEYAYKTDKSGGASAKSLGVPPPSGQPFVPPATMAPPPPEAMAAEASSPPSAPSASPASSSPSSPKPASSGFGGIQGSGAK